MARYRCRVYLNDRSPRYLVLWSLQWEIVECRHVEPGGALLDAMRAAIGRAGEDGWVAEGSPEFGFVFLRRGAARRLLMLTPRDPRDSAPQSFDPFRA